MNTRDLRCIVTNPMKHRNFELFTTGEFSDFTVCYHDVEYRVHRCILFASGCEYFRRLLSSSSEENTGNQKSDAGISHWKESDAGISHWKESSSITFQFDFMEIEENAKDNSFRAFLIYLYTGYIAEEDMKQYSRIFYEFGNYFQLSLLKRACLPSIKSALTVDNLIEILDWIQRKGFSGDVEVTIDARENDDSDSDSDVCVCLYVSRNSSNSLDAVIAEFIQKNRSELSKKEDFHCQMLPESILRLVIFGEKPIREQKSSTSFKKDMSIGQKLAALRLQSRNQGGNN
jgi:hypothetical protein